jgi:uncharacterized OB-fold protein
LAIDTAMFPIAANSVIRVGPDGAPQIEAFRCGSCSAVVTEQTIACRACGTREAPESFRSPETGALWTWSMVHRSYPGIKVPFISAIVDIDGGLTLKGTVLGTEPDVLHQGLRLKLVFDDAGGAHDKEGAPYIGFHFIPEGDA